MTAATPVLEVRGAVRHFGEVEALRGVDLAIAPGEVVGLLGPNGAGKTTLVRLVATLVSPDSGSIAVCGSDVAASPTAARAHLGLAGQHASVDQLLTGQENLQMVGRLYGLSAADCAARVEELLRSLGLEDAADRRASTYSGGMRRRLDLGATLIGEPSLLLLDEPTVGLDPRSRLDLWDLIEQIARRGTSVLVTSQHLDEVERLADRVVVLRDGEVIADDRPAALIQRVGGRTLEDVFFALTGEGLPAEAEPDDDPPLAASHLGERVRPTTSRSALRDVGVITRRCWKHLVRTPQALFFALVQPVLFVVGLQTVFGDLVEQAVGTDYIQFLLPGVVVMNVALMAGQTAIGLTTDLSTGVVDRFRSLPMAQVAVLAGRTTTDLLRSILAMAVMVGAGFAVGFRLEGGIARGLAAAGIALLFAYALMWVFASIGLAVKDPQAAAFLGFAPMLLFVYVSSAWVPIETMGSAVRGFARNQPVNVTIEAVRGLVNGTEVGSQVVRSLAWSLVLAIAFAALATRQLRRTTS